MNLLLIIAFLAFVIYLVGRHIQDSPPTRQPSDKDPVPETKSVRINETLRVSGSIKIPGTAACPLPHDWVKGFGIEPGSLLDLVVASKTVTEGERFSCIRATQDCYEEGNAIGLGAMEIAKKQKWLTLGSDLFFALVTTVRGDESETRLVAFVKGEVA